MSAIVKTLLFTFLLFVSADKIMVKTIGPAVVRLDDVLGVLLSVFYLVSVLARRRAWRPPTTVAAAAFLWLFSITWSYVLGNALDARVFGYTLRAFWFAWLFLVVLPWAMRRHQNVPNALCWSFVLIGLFSLIQFVAGLSIGSAPLVNQWFGPVPRVSGLSYEPSYFATYMLGGFSFAGVRLRRVGWTAANAVEKMCFVLSAFAIVASTSRIGIAAALVVFLLGGFWRIPDSALSKVMWILSGFTAAAFVYPHFASVMPGEHSWWTSVSPRIAQALAMVSLWHRSPFVGNGLGYTGGAWQETGQNIFLEIAAGTGLIGLWAFFVFLVSIFRLRTWLDAYSAKLALASQVLALMFNQNVFRLYVWMWLSYILAETPFAAKVSMRPDVEFQWQDQAERPCC